MKRVKWRDPGEKKWKVSPLPGSPPDPDRYYPDGIFDFTLAWDRGVGHAYNQMASANFTNAFLIDDQYRDFYVPKDFNRIQEAFLNHAQYLMDDRAKRIKKSPREMEAAAEADRVRRRRQTVSNCPSW